MLYNMNHYEKISLSSSQNGFTIVELLVVIIVIGILVTIAVVSYSVITENAKKQSVATDAQTMASNLAKYKSEHGAYPSNLASLTDAPQTNTTYQYAYNGTAGTYCLTASGEKTSVYVTNSNNTPKDGGCPGHGVNGLAPVTNLFTNPSGELNTTNWTIALTGVTSTVVTTEKHSGTRSMRIVTPGTAVAEGAVVTVAAPSMGGNRYSGGIWVKAPAGAQLYMTIRTSGTVAQDNPQVAITGNGTWQFYSSNNKLAQSDATTIQVHVRTRSTAQALTFYVDDAIAIQGESINAYADGYSDNWIWNGTPNASTSTGPRP